MSDEHSCNCAQEIYGQNREIQDLKHDLSRHAITSSQEVTGLKKCVIKAEAINNRLREDILNELHEIIPKQLFESVRSRTNGLSGSVFESVRSRTNGLSGSVFEPVRSRTNGLSGSVFESVRSRTNGLSGSATVHTENKDADDTTSNHAGDNITRNYQPSEPAQPVRRTAGLDRYEGQFGKSDVNW